MVRVFNRRIESLFLPARYTARRDQCNCFRLSYGVKGPCVETKSNCRSLRLSYSVTWYQELNSLTDCNEI
jgi:hypothetical protein